MKATRLSRFGLLLTEVFFLYPGRALLAQASQAEPSAFTAAMERLAQADTAGAITGLREVTRSSPRFGLAFLKLGALLSAQAGEAQANRPRRAQAREALARAAELMPDDPFVMLEYGLLLQRQQLRNDAARALGRAWRAAERRAEQLPPADVARLHSTLGLIYEAWWEDFDGLIELDAARVGTLRCGRLDEIPPAGAAGLAMAAVTCPTQFNDAVRRYALRLWDLKAHEREQMMAHFRFALAAQPGDAVAATRLLSYLAEDSAWVEFDTVVRRLREAAPDEARGALFAGLSLHQRGRDAEADSAFRQALARMAPADRRVFHDIAPILSQTSRARYLLQDSAGRADVERTYFAARDPILLTGAEERRLEHYARLAWADLRFGDPLTGERGWDTDRGRIWVRYGPPWGVVQCCFGESRIWGEDGPVGAYRMVFWSYGPVGPVFVFAHPLSYRRARLTETAELLADEVAAETPQQYAPPGISRVLSVPHQIARFRAAAPRQTHTEIYAAFPVDSLHLSPGDSANAGVFLFDLSYHPLASRVHRLVPWSTGDATYAFDLQLGTYRYGLEARAPGPETLPRPLARVRDTMVVVGFPPGPLAVSDLLLADSVSARIPNPTRRADVFVLPSRTLEFGRTDRVHVYFEVYNLASDRDSLRRYRVEMAVEDSTHRDLASRVWRGVTELVRRRDRPAVVEWERTTAAVGDRAVDYFTLAAPPFESGVYSIRVRVTDEVTGATAESRRLFRVP